MPIWGWLEGITIYGEPQSIWKWFLDIYQTIGRTGRTDPLPLANADSFAVFWAVLAVPLTLTLLLFLTWPLLLPNSRSWIEVGAGTLKQGTLCKMFWDLWVVTIFTRNYLGKGFLCTCNSRSKKHCCCWVMFCWFLVVKFSIINHFDKHIANDYRYVIYLLLRNYICAIYYNIQFPSYVARMLLILPLSLAYN